MEKVFLYEKFIDIHNYIKALYPDHLVFIQNGYYFEILNEDAEYCNQLYGWTIYERQANIPMTGFTDNIRKIWSDLRKFEKPYVLVSQLEKGDNPKRGITEIFP